MLGRRQVDRIQNAFPEKAGQVKKKKNMQARKRESIRT